MPYKDPEKRKAVQRASQQRRRQANGAKSAQQAVADGDLSKLLPDAPDEDELIRLLGVQARLGSVQAAKLLLDRIEREKHVDSDTDSLSGIDELASRRAA
jgi:hypothetical protein